MKRILFLLLVILAVSTQAQTVVKYNDVKNDLNRVYNPNTGAYDFIRKSVATTGGGEMQYINVVNEEVVVDWSVSPFAFIILDDSITTMTFIPPSETLSSTLILLIGHGEGNVNYPVSWAGEMLWPSGSQAILTQTEYCIDVIEILFLPESDYDVLTVIKDIKY